MSTLDERIGELARAPMLLVGSDYDGTLAEIVADPAAAFPHRAAMVAVRLLAELPQTHVAILSGRALEELARLSGAPHAVHLVGSHGSEFDAGFARSLAPDVAALRDRIVASVEEIASAAPGFLVERKPAGVAFHYRGAAPDAAERAIERVLAGPASAAGVHVRRGHQVVELAVVPTHKGDALDHVRQQVGASATLFLGDDVTDEDAFRVLRGPDVGVKVGHGETCAQYRVAGPIEVARLLADLAERRAAWLAGGEAVPIPAHAYLSDLRAAALVTPAGRITWFCAPRIDSPPLFAELLGGPTAGFFAIGPPGDDDGEQRYADDSLVLETRWGELVLEDYLDVSQGRPEQRPGRSDLVRVLRGRGRARIRLAPRIGFGRFVTKLVPIEGGLRIDGGADPIVLRAPRVAWRIELEGQHDVASADVDVDGEPLVFELRYGTAHLGDTQPGERERALRTRRYWSSWAAGLALPEVARDAVLRSALTLKALCFGPTGGICAAATTSLPETLGGVRNWDYRYVWLRDAALSADALVRLGSLSEAMRLLDWILAVLDHLPGPERLRPLYQVNGQEIDSEAEISELAGYAGSRPVRVGNAAGAQVQLDVFGPIVALVDRLHDAGAPLSAEHGRLVAAMAEAVELRWHEPDHGIWEVRGPQRHYVHSKAMCWLALDRAAKLAEDLVGAPRPRWAALAKRIAHDVLQRGYDERCGAFTIAYGEPSLDASVLLVGLCGLVPPSDPRFVSTVEAVERELRDGPTVYRYRFDDGLPGAEGGFHLCAAWLVEALLAIGRKDDARALFEAWSGLTGPTGLLSEQFDPRAKKGLGNHPQAYSHLGLIQNALALAESRSSE